MKYYFDLRPSQTVASWEGPSGSVPVEVSLQSLVYLATWSYCQLALSISPSLGLEPIDFPVFF